MDTRTLDKLYLEIAQFTNAKTAKELRVEGELKAARERNDKLTDLLRSAHCIAVRKGDQTAWERFAESIAQEGIGAVTARTYKVLPSDIDTSE